MAQPQPGQEPGCLAADDVDDGRAGVGTLQIEGQVVVTGTVPEELGQRRDVLGQLVPGERADGPLAPAELDDAVVIEHRHAVGGHPHVALQTGRSEAEAQREGGDRVVAGMGAGAPVGEGDGGVEQRRQPLLHDPR